MYQYRRCSMFTPEKLSAIPHIKNRFVSEKKKTSDPGLGAHKIT